ncbi:hypothetical protein CI109_100364 [Kwoniella shandongensis]|uniref:Uncharacterized protein n=1 Tax=Kwoniella shandongensis TaxID=1734106 RepID=A0AAJ8MTW4_9TREE
MARLASHPVLDKLLRSLVLDTGNLLFSISLRLLLEIIPYAPLLLTSKVPLMAIVLGRVISWRDRPFIDEGSAGGDGYTRTPLPNPQIGWQVSRSSTEPDIEPPDHLKPGVIAQSYLIALYGAWPSNVIAFTRDPALYIQGKNVPPIYALEWDDVWEPGLLATRIVPLIREFRLHPSLVVFTSTAELADDKRWDRIDPSEFTARSRALANADQPGVSRFSLMDEESLVSGTIDRKMDSSRLERENELLRLEAKFTSRVRKQYLHQQSKQIAALTSELSQSRTDASQAQQKHLKWQGQLRDKVASFREEKATWQTEAARIRGELSEARAAIKSQQEELAVVKNEYNQLTEAEPKIRHISDYEIRIKQLTESQRLWDEDVRRRKEAHDEAEAWRVKCYEKLRVTKEEAVSQAQRIRCVSSPPFCAKTSSILEQRAPITTHVASTAVNKDVPISPSPNRDLVFYSDLLEQSRLRSERLGRENLELEGMKIANNDVTKEGDRSFIWGNTIVG